MRFRLMAMYRGVPYQAGLGPDGTEATLFSPGPPPEELGFTAGAGHWRKQVSLADLDSLWQSRPVGDYRGEPCLVLDDLGDRLHIAYLGRDAARAAQLGYWEIDREVFEVVVARNEVTALTEDRMDFPLTAAMFPSSGEADNEYAAPTESAGFEEYRAATVNGGPTGNDQVAVYGGSDHASRMPDRMAAWHGSPEPWPGPQTPAEAGSEPRSRPESWAEQGPGEPQPQTGPRPAPEPWSGPWTEQDPGSEPETDPGPVRRTGRKDRISPESVFAELLSLAAIPQAAWAVDEEVPGAMCLVEADGGFEVFSRTDDARLEVHFFEDEEAAYFYLFGVLAAEAVRSGRLEPSGATSQVNGHSNGSGHLGPAAPAGHPRNVSKYLRGGKLHNSASHPARVYLAGGADGPPLPKQPRRPPEAQLDKFNLRITNLFPCL
jgi:hypothetical protein